MLTVKILFTIPVDLYNSNNNNNDNDDDDDFIIIIKEKLRIPEWASEETGP